MQAFDGVVRLDSVSLLEQFLRTKMRWEKKRGGKGLLQLCLEVAREKEETNGASGMPLVL